MATLSLRIHIVKSNNVKMMQFDENMIVYDACNIIRERIPDAAQGKANEFGLFKPDEDPKKGRWLELGRTLEYYHLKNGDVLEYRIKQRPLRVKMMDESVKTHMVDDSQNVSELIKSVCARIGLSNPEEFSFIAEEELKKPLKKAAGMSQKKMETLKKQLHTDDNLNWLNPEKSLREQGIDETQVLVLRKKFFFTDQNVDRNDPIQLHLLYVQSRDAIIEGVHPVNKEEATQFAALQCQIQYGNHNEAKHKGGFLNLSEFLPKEYVKAKAIEKSIFQEHRKLHSLTELNAKFRYIQLCRSLKTYGVTFFLVKEKMKGRNKLVPRLLGITRDSVMRVDETTKEVLKTWPLTTVQRWAASPNSFTLDFGDYSDSFYSVQTTEGETISQLIAGYIDIVMKKKKARQFEPDQEDDENAITEFEVGSQRANVTAIQSGGHGSGTVGNVGNLGTLQQAVPQGGDAQVHEGPLSQMGVENVGGIKHSGPGGAISAKVLKAQDMLRGTITNGLEIVNGCSSDLGTAASLPHVGSDSASIAWRKAEMDLNRQNVSSALAAVLASTASIITQTGTDPSEIDYTSVGSAVTTISTNLTGLVNAVRILAALNTNPSDSSGLLDAARQLAAATAGLLNTAQPENMDNRQELLTAAGEVGTAGGVLLQRCGEAMVDQKTQETLISMAKAVASSTAALVSNARNVASRCSDQALQNQVISAAKATALATQALITCTKVLSPSIDYPLCQEQLIEACKMVAAAVERIVIAAQAACGDDDALRDLGAAATAVTAALHSLIQQIREGLRVADDSQCEDACEVILAATESLVNSMGNAQEMVTQAKRLAEATQSLVSAIKLEADLEGDPDARKRLLDAAKCLADATSKMVEAAKGAARNANDPSAQAALKFAAEELRAITNATASTALKKRAIRKLEVAARHACACGTQLIAASQGAGATNANEVSQHQLMNQCKIVSEQMSKLIQCVRATMEQPESASCQLSLINSSQAILAPGGRLVAAAKAAVPTVGDQPAALQLGNSAKVAAAAVSDLRSAANKAAEVCGSLEIESAIDVVHGLARDIELYKQEALAGKLLLLPGETVAACALELGATSKLVGSSMAQLLTAANQGNESYTGVAARDTAHSLKVLSKAVRGVAAGTDDKDTQDYILQSAKQVMEQSVSLIREAKNAVETPNQPNKQLKLAQAAKAVSQALNQVVNCLPGQRDVDQAIKAIAEASQALQKNQFPPSGGRSYHDLQNQLSTAAAALNACGTELFSSARGTPEQLASTAKEFARKYQDLLRTGLTLAGASKDKDAQDSMVGFLRTISVSSSKLLLAAKALSADPNAPNVVNQLAAAARAVTDSINELLNVCSSSAPGQKECENALRKVEAVAALLDRPSEPVSDATYFECLEAVSDRSQVLGKAGAEIPIHAKAGKSEDFGNAVNETADAVCQIVEAASQAAYLVGISDPTSTPAQQGLVDQTQFSRAGQAISKACQSLLNSSATQQQVLQSATVIAKHTSVLCNACKVASQRTNNPVAKKHFVTAAKDVANNTANLVKNIKALAGQLTPENREACAATTKPLIEAVEALTTFASSAQFASTPAVIGEKGREAMSPIQTSGKAIIQSSSSLLSASKSLAVNPKDSATWQLLVSHSKAVSDSVKALLQAIKFKSPGQSECDQAMEVMNQIITNLNKAEMAVLSQNLIPDFSSTLEGFQNHVLQSASDISELVEPLAVAAKGEAENLGHRVTALSNQIPQLATAAIGTASKTKKSQMKSQVIAETKTVVESALQLVYASKEVGGNPKSGAHHLVDEGADFLNKAVKELSETIQKAGSEMGVINGFIDDVNKAILRLQEHAPQSDKTFTDFQGAMFDLCKKVSKSTQDLVTHAGQNPSILTEDARYLTNCYSKLVDEAQGAISEITENQEVAVRLKKNMENLGGALADVLNATSSLVVNPDDISGKRELLACTRAAQEKISFVVGTLKSGSKGTQACLDAYSAVMGIVSDLETAKMFAASGVLFSEGGNVGLFPKHREEILETAKTLLEATKELVTSAGASQDDLAAAASRAVETITKESECIKMGAASLGAEDTEAQVLLLNAAKDVGNSLAILIKATRDAAGKSVQDPTMATLKDSAKSMVTNISALLKTVKNVENEARKGVRSLEQAIKGIEKEMETFKSAAPSKKSVSPEELIRCANKVTMATAKAVSAGNSTRQQDITAAAQMVDYVVSMLQHAKAAASRAETKDLKKGVMDTGGNCANAYKELLELVVSIVDKPTYEKKQMLLSVSREVAVTVGELVNAAEALKGPDWVNPEDPTVIAENELLAAAAAIEAAARKLEELQPRKEVKVDETLTFDEQIVEAAKRIANATSQLVKAATAAQRELVAQGRVKPSDVTSEDYQWSEGLVSAAKLVATATSNLCEAANLVVQDQASEDKLIAAAKSVASSTAQLLMACQVKADPRSESNKRLQQAGGKVKKATEFLVKAANASKQKNEGDMSDYRIGATPMSKAKQFAAELDAHEIIAAKERELIQARNQLKQLRIHSAKKWK